MKPACKIEIVGKASKQKRKRHHIPHSQRPQHLVQQRNERERGRANQLNEALSVLKCHLPDVYGDKKASKADILKTAVHYIGYLTTLLHQSEVHSPTHLEELAQSGASSCTMNNQRAFPDCSLRTQPCATSLQCVYTPEHVDGLVTRTSCRRLGFYSMDFAYNTEAHL